EHTSQVVLNGKPSGNRDAYSYFRKEGKDELRRLAHEAFDRLSSRYNPIVLEGAGSISELNLRDGDIVNMSMARYAGADVILVADIDRGGVFASVYGSVMLQTPKDRNRIKGIIINKFRGDLRLFESGRQLLAELCGIPVLGVVPMANHIKIEEEDSVALANKNKSAVGDWVKVGVVTLPHISNFTDFNVLERHPEVSLFYITSPEEIDEADIVIIPGSKNTLADLNHLRKRGFAGRIIRAREAGKCVIGICGGYQMMGSMISDPDGVEGEIRQLPGLGLLPVTTVLTGNKTTRQVKFRFLYSEEICDGYEIHMGHTESNSPLTHDVEGAQDGCFVDERCFGSYIHGILDNPVVLDYILDPYRSLNSMSDFDYHAFKESQYDALAAWLRKYVDIEGLYKIMTDHD
ncbi:MAG: cobyric acid synthase, partial [Muribaculaceae bacterium]|nr:cobyric acid synthase [Muribaculaceae bacterium]